MTQATAAAPVRARSYGFEWMADVIPEASVGSARVSHFEITDDAAALYNMRYDFRGPRFMTVQPGRYARLHVDGDLVMSDTHMERRTNLDPLRYMHGRVLIGGLGLGMLPRALLSRGQVTHVTVVEKSADVIRLIGPYVAEPFTPSRVEIVHGDVFDWKPPRGTRYNGLWMDIWSDISEDSLPGMGRLLRRFSPYLDRNHPLGYFRGCWLRHYLLAEKRRNSR